MRSNIDGANIIGNEEDNTNNDMTAESNSQAHQQYVMRAQDLNAAASTTPRRNIRTRTFYKGGILKQGLNALDASVRRGENTMMDGQ